MVSSINKRSSTHFAPGEAAAIALYANAAMTSGSPSSHKSARTTKSQASAKSTEEKGTTSPDMLFSPASLYSDTASPDLARGGDVPGPRAGHLTRDKVGVQGKEQLGRGQRTESRVSEKGDARERGVKWEVRRKESLIVANPDWK
jgi:hypothetical protein